MRRRGAPRGNDGKVLKALQGRTIGKGLMRADRVVDALPGARRAIEGRHVPGQVVDFVKLLGVRALDAFDGPVELGTLGRQYEQVDPGPLTGALKGREEFRAAIDLNGVDREGHAVPHGGEEVGGGRGRRAFARPSRTSQRETRSRAVNCLSVTPGKGRRSSVSIGMRSPGRAGVYSGGFRTA